MKTLVRIGQAFDSATEAKLAPLAVAMLANAFDKRRKELAEAVLVVDKTPDGLVYITIGPNPPELVVGNRRVFGVFSPIDSQEPLATFHDRDAADEWATSTCHEEGFTVREIDATDRVAIRPCVAVVVKQENDQVLYGRLKRTHQWTIPEGELLLGETAEGAARRTVREQFGIEIGAVSIPARVPYINIFFPELGHYLSLLLVAPALGEPEIKSDLYDAWVWGSAATPPEPQFVTVAAIKKVLATTEPTGAPLPLPLPLPLPSQPPSSPAPPRRQRPSPRSGRSSSPRRR